jgi:Cu(I)/Ag(I) efflux system membrane protein CusA/SilA
MVNSQNNHPQGFLASLISFCARNWLLTILLCVGASLWGWRSLMAAPLDAIPDMSDAQVIVFTDWPGRSPDLVEDQITYPLSTTLLAAPKVKFVRGQSFMGLSFVYVIFEDGTDIYWARSRVLEYLNSASADLPDGVTPTLGPDATGVGWVYQYALSDKTGNTSLSELRSLQDFNLRYALEAVQGVAEVASVGGYEKEYQVNIDPDRLAAYNIPLQNVAAALRRSNNDVGGRVLEISGHEHFIRGRGYITSTADLEGVVLSTTGDGIPVKVSDIATVSLGPAMQRGSAELNGEGLAVGGIVVMRFGENALDVINRVKARLEEVKASLPEGVEIIPVYDRSGLIERSIDTLSRTLSEEILIVSLVIIVFLLHLRSALVAIITLPIAILLAFIPMYYQGLTANIMSLGGIAVAIGAMVDAAIAIVENIHRRLALWREQTDSSQSRTDVIIAAMQEVGPSIFFALLIIAVSFLPVFALEGSEGRLFKPLAYTKTYSMFFAALLSVTLIPALAVLLIRGRIRGENSWLNRSLIALYAPVVRWVVRSRWLVVGVGVIVLLSAIIPFRGLGSEFMPPLNEGSILYMPTALPGMSISEAQKTLHTMNRELMTFPEVKTVFGKVGRSTSATDSAPLSMIETNITLKPKSEWREGMDWDSLIAEMDQKLRFPGMPNIWWMPIQTRTQMLATGIRSALGIKVFGPDLATIESTATAIERALQSDSRTTDLTRSAFAERTTGGYFLDFDIDRDAASRYGLNVADIQDVIEMAIGGTVVSQTVEGRERYNILMRYNRDYRDSITALERTYVTTSHGSQIPISQVATLQYRKGPPMIRNEDGQLVGFVFVDVADNIGIPNYVALAKKVVAEKVDIPSGYRLAWAGQFENYERAKSRLEILVPMTLGLIFMMLYFHRKSLIETLIVMLALPFSLVGSLWFLWMLEYKISVAVAVGMIAVAGLAVELGLLMMLYLDISWRQRRDDGQLNSFNDLTEAVVDGAAKRLRPKLMTGLALLMGLVPIMLSNGSGADLMKRVAAPMLGGVATSLIMVLVVFPALFVIWKQRSKNVAPAIKSS